MPAERSVEEWNKIRKTAEAEAAALTAQKKLENARKALEPDRPDGRSQALKVQNDQATLAKGIAEKNKAEAEARKAQAEADAAALKAKLEVPSSGYAGRVELKEKAGTAEASLLAAKAVADAAKRIVEALALPGEPPLKDVVLLAPSEVPTFNALTAFRAQTELIADALKQAEAVSNSVGKAPIPTGGKMLGIGGALPAVAAAPPILAAGLALDAANKLLGFFRTDYTVGGVEVAAEDMLLIHALAGALAANTQLVVHVPGSYYPKAVTMSCSALLETLRELSERVAGARESAAEHARRAKELEGEADATENDAARKAKLERSSKVHKSAGDALAGAAILYDSFLGKLTSPDEKGMAPLAAIVREQAMEEALANGGVMLVVKLHKTGGSHYTKKNFLAGLGRMPFFHMGGAVASYLLLRGDSGAVVKSGVVTVHGGFVSADELRKYVNGS